MSKLDKPILSSLHLLSDTSLVDNTDICCTPHHSWCACSRLESKRSHSRDLASSWWRSIKESRSQGWVQDGFFRIHRGQSASCLSWISDDLCCALGSTAPSLKVTPPQVGSSKLPLYLGLLRMDRFEKSNALHWINGKVPWQVYEASTRDTGRCCNCHISSCNPLPWENMGKPDAVETSISESHKAFRVPSVSHIQSHLPQ